MKKYWKYAIKGFGFFVTMALLDYLFNAEIDLKVNIGTVVVYIVLNILYDYFIEKKKK